MARATTRYVCQACGIATAKWAGRCESCGEWNSLAEEAGGPSSPWTESGKGSAIELVALNGAARDIAKLPSHIAEFDRALGGGMVPGAAILIGGDPGIGKSTLLLQAAASYAKQGLRTVYVSGEEAVAQIRMRSRRLGIGDAPVELGSGTNVRDIIATFGKGDAPQVVVIDSIQTMYLDALESAPGSVGQVRASAHELIRFGKQNNVCVILVGHVTKEGQIAGPRLLEHMVDTVLYFEGERGHQFRILRAVKNRYGPADELGVFEMTDAGLLEVQNPSALFLSDSDSVVPGAAVLAGIEGSRPMLVEIQALVAPSSLATPRRAVVGWDGGRLAMITAVLETRGGLSFAGQDIYLNVAGGLRIGEPAADLAVAAALVSSMKNQPLPQRSVLFGELSLAGEVRPVSQPETRLREALKLGFGRAYVPSGCAGVIEDLKVTEVGRIQDLIELV